MSYVPGNQDSWDTVAKQFDVMSPLLPFGNGSEITPCPRPELYIFPKERIQYAVCNSMISQRLRVAKFQTKTKYFRKGKNAVCSHNLT